MLYERQCKKKLIVYYESFEVRRQKPMQQLQPENFKTMHAANWICKPSKVTAS